MSKKEIEVKVTNDKSILNGMGNNLIISRHHKRLKAYGIETIYIVPNNCKKDVLHRVAVFTSAAILSKDETNGDMTVNRNKYGSVGNVIKEENLSNILNIKMDRQYFSPKGGLLAYFGEPPEEGMKYIVVELTGKWYTFYEIHSDGSVHDSPLATDTTTIGYYDDKWDPNDLINFIDEHEDEYYIPDLSKELFVGRWDLEVTETY